LYSSSPHLPQVEQSAGATHPSLVSMVALTLTSHFSPYPAVSSSLTSTGARHSPLASLSSTHPYKSTYNTHPYPVSQARTPVSPPITLTHTQSHKHSPLVSLTRTNPYQSTYNTHPYPVSQARTPVSLTSTHTYPVIQALTPCQSHPH
jgi:hypothetical protein